MVKKHRMPKTRAEFEESIKNAFLAGCTWGYGVEHTVDMREQENIGAEVYIGNVLIEDATKRLEEIRGFGVDYE